MCVCVCVLYCAIYKLKFGQLKARVSLSPSIPYFFFHEENCEEF